MVIITRPPLSEAELDALIRENRRAWDECDASDEAANAPWLDADTPPPTRNQKIIVTLAVALGLLCLGTAFVPQLLAWVRP